MDRKIASFPKMILTVVWNPHGFHLIDVLPKGSKFDAGHYISLILSAFPEILAPYQDYPRRNFVIHADNARPHCAKIVTLFLDHNSRRRAPHPPYSPDQTHFDCWIFEDQKVVLQRGLFDETDELVSAIQEIF
jgi:hypothetical protein